MSNKAAIAKYKKLKKISESSNSRRALKARIKLRHRCALCGRSRGYIRKFDICRICFKSLASSGQLPGVKKVNN